MFENKCGKCNSFNKNYFIENRLQNISSKKKDYIEDMIVTYKDIDLEKLFKIAQIVKKIEIKSNMENFIEYFDKNVKDLNKIDLEDN